MHLKETIIHESLRLFSLKGFNNSSLQDILKASKSSKGGFYNHFKSKEDLFHQVMHEARIIWRERILYEIDDCKTPSTRIKKFFENYKNRYLIDSDNFPGGCVFITLSAELNDQSPHLSKEIDVGFNGVKNFFSRNLNESAAAGELKNGVNISNATEILFSGMLGASVIFGTNKSVDSLNRSIDSLIDYLESLKRK
ncbi:MAG: TetR/AcrR family transcriptional regulator [Deltaproteobacteria bacterium]|jgi:TetR/AcrR family transcriptional regulator, transcriptional repressor for nem operon|nr:TetR/AcrR family transcriptional regulator [Deltaproteobacteria bacterium]